MMQLYDEDEELVFYDEEKEKEEAAAIEENAKDDFIGLYEENPFINRPLFQKMFAEDTGDFVLLEKLKQLRDETRAKRRQTSRITGNFWLDILVMLTFSPIRFWAGWEIFSNFRHLGQRELGKRDSIADLLYKRKECAFWSDIFNLSFILPTFGKIIQFGLASFGLKLASGQLNSGGFFHKLWYLFLIIVAFEVAWNAIKAFLKSLLGVMEESYNTVMESKNKAEKTRKAQQAKADAELKKAQKENNNSSTAKEPIRPCARGRNRQSGG